MLAMVSPRLRMCDGLPFKNCARRSCTRISMIMETMYIRSRSALKFLVVLAAAACLTFGMNLASAGDEDEGALQRALERFVSGEGGAPGIIVVVARGKSIDVHTAG